MNFIVKLRIYPMDVMFSFGETNEELEKKFKGFNVKTSNYFDSPFDYARCTQFTNGQVVVRLRDFPDSPKGKGALAHEILHAVCYVMSYIGGKLSSNSEESYCYLMGYLTEQAEKEIDKYLKTKNEYKKG